MTSPLYFILGCFGPEEEDRAGIGEIPPDMNWNLGRRFDQPPRTPLEVSLNPDFPGIMVPMFDSGILLFTDAMIAALREAGVDNLDCYEVVIRDPLTGKEWKDYQAVNIIGLVAAADLSESVYSADSGVALIDTDFDSLAIDESKALGSLMFRLAECVSAIVVHRKVKEKLEGRGIPYLDFTNPSDWIG